MDDRIPTPGLEGRVKITKEDGTSFLAFLEMADNPSNPGTPISKATLLKDATAAMFGFGDDAVPDEVLAKIKTLIDSTTALARTKAEMSVVSYTGTGTYGEANPTSITFGFTPKVVLLFDAANDITAYRASLAAFNIYFLIWGVTTGYFYANGSYGPVSYSGNTVSLYNTKQANLQLNESGQTYYAVAFGYKEE